MLLFEKETCKQKTNFDGKNPDLQFQNWLLGSPEKDIEFQLKWHGIIRYDD